MTPAEHRQERDKRLSEAAKLVAKALPQHFGSVQFNIQNGLIVSVNVNESVKLAQ